MEVKFPTPRNEKGFDKDAATFNTANSPKNYNEDSKEIEVPHIASSVDDLSQVSSNEKSMLKI